MEHKKKKSGCVDFESVSASFDGECKLKPEQEEHIQSCGMCQSRLRYLQAVRNAIRSAAMSVCGRNIAERILAGIHRKLEQERKKRLPVILFLVPAVLIVLLVLVFLLFCPSCRFRAGQDASSPSEHAAASVPFAPELEWDSRMSRGPHPVLVCRTPRTFLCRTMPEGAGGFFFLMSEEDPSVISLLPGMLPASVRGFWFSGTLSADLLRRKLTALCKDLNVLESCQVRSSDRLLFLTGKLPAGKAAVLLRQLHAWGLKTPSDPSRGRDLFLGDGSEPTKIDLTFSADGRGSVLPDRETLLRSGNGRSVPVYLR